ncbi:hypothetical protein ABEB36_008231 [Hypothenemus hampei]|uniref:Uncharacterized protein n=1 Tax=Hypothenemus hampei TaxID=57062 RepID=A0ABD1EL91_HYPHA
MEGVCTFHGRKFQDENLQLTLEKNIKNVEFDGMSAEPHQINQAELCDLICYLNLSKNQKKLLPSRLKSWNVFDKETTIFVLLEGARLKTLILFRRQFSVLV